MEKGNTSFGPHISEELSKIEDEILNFNIEYPSTPPYYNEEGLMAATNIFLSTVTDFFFRYRKKDLEEFDNIQLKSFAKNLTNDILKLTGIDTKTFYKTAEQRKGHKIEKNKNHGQQH